MCQCGTERHIGFGKRQRVTVSYQLRPNTALHPTAPNTVEKLP